MNALPPAPDRAQRVRGIPGVGLRTADGREWVAGPNGRYVAIPVVEPHETIRVQSCARPGKWGNPWKVVEAFGGWCVANGYRLEPGTYETKELATAEAIRRFGELVRSWPDAMFDVPARADFLSCFCPLDGPCHVDAILAEGARRGQWGGG